LGRNPHPSTAWWTRSRLVVQVRARALLDALIVGVPTELVGLCAAIAHSRSDLPGATGGRGVVGVRAALLGGGGLLEAVIGVNLVLELWGDLPVVVEVGAP
jgi:hypothetical protein